MMLFNAVRRKQWADRQETLKAWRNGIWENNDEAGINSYLNWHLDFFSRFYHSPGSVTEQLLDIGCGYLITNFRKAEQLDHLMNLIGARYVGLDPIGDWLVGGTYGPGPLCLGIGEELPFGDNQFSATMLLGVLDHVLDPQRVLSEAYRVTKTGGALWFANSYIEGNSWHVFKEKVSHRLGFNDHHRYTWTTDDLQDLIHDAGFSIKRTDRCLCNNSFYIQGCK